jgi:DNA-binding NarL/FixJ family response regulator
MIDEDQIIRHTRVDGRSIAWSVIGDGPPLFLGAWWASHLELDWRDPRFRRFVRGLSDFRTVLRYDRAGTGASDRDGAPPGSSEREPHTIAALLETVDAGPADVLGISMAVPETVAFTAMHPHLVERLILYGGYSSGSALAPAPARSSMLTAVGQHWGIGSRLLADVFLPDATPAERIEFATAERRSMTGDVAKAALSSAYAFDASGFLPHLHVPALVLNRRGDRAVPVARGRELASQIAGARFIPLDGVNHLPWHGDSSELLRVLLGFIGVAPGVARVTAGGELTTRERAVLRLVAQGLTDQQIAGNLVVSSHTVHRHVANVRRKLNVSSRAAAVAWAAQHGVV